MNDLTLNVVGGGAWGTALANMLAGTGRAVNLWALEDEVVNEINQLRENKQFLPGIELSSRITASNDLEAACQASVLLLVAPAQHMRSLCEKMAPHVKDGTVAVNCAKGVEQDSLALMSDILGDTLPQAEIAVLSGPTFAAEVAQGLPTAVTLACRDAQTGEQLAELIGTPCFRPYYTDDIVGAQIGGAVKNVLAIGCGIAEGRCLGENARAALISRAIAEIIPLGEALGGRRETLMGLSGLGDLILTATSDASRNYSLGMALGEGQSLNDIMRSRRAVTEGVHSAGAVVALARRNGLDVPICEGVNAILNEGVAIETVIDSLLHRPFTDERTGEALHGTANSST